MTTRAVCRAAVAVVAALLMIAKPVAQTRAVPRTPWGDPDLQGTFTNKDESGLHSSGRVNSRDAESRTSRRPKSPPF